MKVVINPKYSHLSEYIHNIPTQCYAEDSVIKRGRNILRKDMVDGVSMVIKQYKKPSLFNRIVYSFIRKSKARRSYEYAFKLRKMDIGTAKPIAYIEEKKNGFFHTGYFISVFIPHPLLSSVIESRPKEFQDIMQDFVQFTVDVHKKGVIHYDYNLSNVHYHKEGERYQFALIDINRMQFNRYSKRKCMRTLRVLGLQLPYFTAFAEQYAVLRGWNAEVFCGALLMKRGYKNIRLKFKHKIKAIIGFA